MSRQITPQELLISIDLLYFIPFVSKHYNKPEHLKPLINELNKIVLCQNECRLLVTIPPRHGKTETICHFIAYYLSHYPHKTVGYISYNDTQATSKTLKAQRYCLQTGLNPDPKLQNQKEWRTIQGGGILTTGIGGALTGQGLDVAIVDDPVKNPEEAESEIYRNKTWRWFEDVLETRLEPGASSIIVMTRWHEDDLGGRIIARRPEYKVIRIPALADCLDEYGKDYKPDPNGRLEGESLWGERYTKEDLEKIKHDKPFTYSALYQGLPRAREDRLFNGIYYYNELPEGLRYATGIDLAYTIKTHSDQSALTRMARLDDYYYIVYNEVWKQDINYTKRYLKEYQSLHPERYGVEANGPQAGIADTLEDFGISIKRMDCSNDKYVRALPFIEAWAAGKVLVPNPETLPNNWLNSYLEELFNFTGIKDKFDNRVDSSVYAFLQLKSGGAKFRKW